MAGDKAGASSGVGKSFFTYVYWPLLRATRRQHEGKRLIESIPQRGVVCVLSSLLTFCYEFGLVVF